MSISPISPIAPARVRAVLVPLGKIKKQRFDTFVAELREDHIVRLGDISPDALAERTAFSPLAFPNGSIIYELSTTPPTASHASLFPYETFRESLIVLCLADVNEYGHNGESLELGETQEKGTALDKLRQAVYDIKEHFPQALLVQPLLFDLGPETTNMQRFKDFIVVPTTQFSHIKTIMCDVSARFLAELSTFARSIQMATSIPTPAGTSRDASAGMAKPSRPTGLLRTTSLRATAGTPEPAQTRGSRDDVDELPELTEVESAPAELADYQESQISTPRDSIGTRESSPAPRARQVSRDSSVDSLARREVDDGKKQVANPRRTLLRNLPSPAELAERRLRARQTLIIGSLYLQAGRWSDALRELSDGATLCQVNEDHFWHAKALENMLVAMLLLARGGIEFQIPETCLVSASRTSQKRSSSATIPRNSNARLSGDSTITRLALLIPDLCHRVLDIYIRGFSNTSELLSRHAFSETIIRLAALLVLMHNAGGSLTTQLLNDMIIGSKTADMKNSNPSIPTKLTKLNIAEFLFRAFPPQANSLSTTSTDTAVVFAGMSFVLGELGLKRKQAMINKELLATLVLVIARARRSDLSSLNLAAPSINGSGMNDSTQAVLTHSDIDMHVLMNVTGRAYGLVQSARRFEKSSVDRDMAELAQEIVHDAFESARLQRHGSLRMKLQLLRLYSNVAEVIPDYLRVIYYTAAILEVIGPHSAPKQKFSGKIRLPKDEQIRYITKIHNTVSFLPRTVAQQARAKYWDPFLVRSIRPLPAPTNHSLKQRSMHDLIVDSTKAERVQKAGPFLHDAFSTTTADSAVERMLVRNETVEFVVILQNLYDFSVVVEAMSLLSTGVDFDASTISTVLGPSGLHQITLSGRPLVAGKLDILGCRVKVEGCGMEDFFLFEESWTMARDSKIKSSKGGAKGNSATIQPTTQTNLPQMKRLVYDVLDSQPILSAAPTLLQQAAISLLDGELRTFTLTLHNDSRDTDVDFVHISFVYDSIVTEISDLSDFQQYEIAYERKHRPLLYWQRTEDGLPIKPGQTAEYVVELHATPALANCEIVIDYANLEGDLLQTKKKFFTRQARLPLAFTVEPSVELLSHNFLHVQQHDDSLPEEDGRSGTFLWTIDVRNLSMRPLHLFAKRHAAIRSGTKTIETEKLDELVQPSQTTRLSLLLPKLFVEDPTRPIPNIGDGQERQFVVSNKRRPSVMELSDRERFWYREELLKQVEINWKEQGGARSGVLNLRPISLNSQMLDIVKRDLVELKLELTSSDNDTNESLMKQRASQIVKIDEVLALKVHLTNTTTRDMFAYLRIKIRHQTQIDEHQAEDIGNCVAWTGQLDRPLQTLAAHQSITLDYGLSILFAADYIVDVDVLRIAGDGSLGKAVGHASLYLHAVSG